MVHSSRADSRRQQIVAGLLRSMAKRGYAGAPISAIAREAGLTPGLVHYYFRSKQQILLSCLDAIRTTVLARYEERCSRAGRDPWRRVAAWTDALLEESGTAAEHEASAAWVAVAAEAVREPAVARAYRALFEELAQRLAEPLGDVLAREGRSAANLPALTGAVVAAVQGVFQVDAVAPSLVPVGSSAPALRHMVAGLVAAQPRARRRATAARRGHRGRRKP